MGSQNAPRAHANPAVLAKPNFSGKLNGELRDKVFGDMHPMEKITFLSNRKVHGFKSYFTLENPEEEIIDEEEEQNLREEEDEEEQEQEQVVDRRKGKEDYSVKDEMKALEEEKAKQKEKLATLSAKIKKLNALKKRDYKERKEQNLNYDYY